MVSDKDCIREVETLASGSEARVQLIRIIKALNTSALQRDLIPDRQDGHYSFPVSNTQ